MPPKLDRASNRYKLLSRNLQAEFLSYFEMNFRRIKLEIFRGHRDDARRRLSRWFRLRWLGVIFLR